MSKLSKAARQWLDTGKRPEGAMVTVIELGIAASRRTAVAHYVADAAEVTMAGEATLVASWLCGGSTVDGFSLEEDFEVECLGCRLAAALPRCPVVYYAWGDDDELLYVGSTVNAPQRFRQHSRSTHWWPEVRRLTFDEFETEPMARRAELRSINERPGTYNLEGRPGRFPAGSSDLLRLVQRSESA